MHIPDSQSTAVPAPLRSGKHWDPRTCTTQVLTALQSPMQHAKSVSGGISSYQPVSAKQADSSLHRQGPGEDANYASVGMDHRTLVTVTSSQLARDTGLLFELPMVDAAATARDDAGGLPQMATPMAPSRFSDAKRL